MSKSFCSLPWIHLATHPHGGISLCCQSEMESGKSMAANCDGSDPITLNEKSISDLVNSKTFRDVRLSMLKGERHPACQPCWDREDKGVTSKRIYESNRFSFTFNEANNATNTDGSIPVSIQFAELRLGNICNLKCVTCNPNSSSAIAGEYQEIKKKPGTDFLRDYSWVKNEMSNWSKDPGFWTELLEHGRDLKEIYINGGEPMLIKEHWLFLEKLIKSGVSSQISIYYSTNLTRLDEKLCDIWKNFKKVHFSCSVDDWDMRNFYIRYPSQWEAIKKNFKKLRDWGYQPHVLQTISSLNFFYLDDFYTKWQNIFPDSVIAYNDVIDPPWFSPLVLPLALRQNILSRLCKTLPLNLVNQLRGMYDSQVDHVNLFGQLKIHLNEMDNLRGNVVTEYFPEFEEYLNRNGLSLT